MYPGALRRRDGKPENGLNGTMSVPSYTVSRMPIDWMLLEHLVNSSRDVGVSLHTDSLPAKA